MVFIFTVTETVDIVSRIQVANFLEEGNAANKNLVPAE